MHNYLLLPLLLSNNKAHVTWFKPLQSSDDDAHRFHPPTFPNPASLHDFLISLHLPAFLSVNTIDISHSRMIPSYDYTLCSWIAHLPRRPLGHRLFPLDISLLPGGARLGRTHQVGAIPVRFISIHRDLDSSFFFVRHLSFCSTQLSHLFLQHFRICLIHTPLAGVSQNSPPATRKAQAFSSARRSRLTLCPQHSISRSTPSTSPVSSCHSINRTNWLVCLPTT